MNPEASRNVQRIDCMSLRSSATNDTQRNSERSYYEQLTQRYSDGVSKSRVSVSSSEEAKHNILCICLVKPTQGLIKHLMYEVETHRLIRGPVLKSEKLYRLIVLEDMGMLDCYA